MQKKKGEGSGKAVNRKEDDENYILENAKKLTYTQIGKDLGMTRNAVGKRAKKLGVPPKFERSSKSQVNEMYRDYLSGLTLAELGRKHGKTAGSLCSLFQRHGKELRSTSEAMRIYEVNEDYFEEINSETKSYILGFLLADGHVASSGFSITLQNKDIRILERFKKEMDSEQPIYKGDKYSTLKISSIKMARDLKKLGLIKRKTWDMPEIDMVDDGFKRHLYRGLFDGDGCIGQYERKNRPKEVETMAILTSGDVDFLEYVRKEINKILGTKCGKVIRNKSSIGTSYKIVWYSNQAKKIVAWMYKDNKISLKRKQKIANKIIGGMA